MYSIGYAGYYGIALMMASYKVLAISIIAHAAQFAFLSIVEEPHINRLYNPPPPRRTRHNSGDLAMEDRPKTSQSDVAFSEPVFDPIKHQPAQTHHIVGPLNTDFHRSIDLTVVLLSFYMFCLATLTPNTWPVRTFLFINAFGWRLWYALGLGYILDRQSKKKNWTKHFIKYGDTKEEAWRQWKSLYHMSTTMSHASFVAVAWKMYSLPSDGLNGLTLFRHVLGAGMIVLQLWVAMSIYESLGEFGWFCGDFFYDPPSRSLTYSGIYRFLNNPERVLGLAGVWGVALITWNPAIFYLATTAHVLNLVFLQFVEKPHVIKVSAKCFGVAWRLHAPMQVVTTSENRQHVEFVPSVCPSFTDCNMCSCMVKTYAKCLVSAKPCVKHYQTRFASGNQQPMNISTLPWSSSRNSWIVQDRKWLPMSTLLSRIQRVFSSLTQRVFLSLVVHRSHLV